MYPKVSIFTLKCLISLLILSTFLKIHWLGSKHVPKYSHRHLNSLNCLHYSVLQTAFLSYQSFQSVQTNWAICFIFFFFWKRESVQLVLLKNYSSLVMGGSLLPVLGSYPGLQFLQSISLAFGLSSWTFIWAPESRHIPCHGRSAHIVSVAVYTYRLLG